jgi:hypothetical protein
MIQRGWAEQYHRTRRSHARLRELASGREPAGSDDAQDALFHFFEDALHLRDWLINDSSVQLLKADIDQAVKASPALAACGDLCNAAKHLKLTMKPWSGATFTNQCVTVSPPTVYGKAIVGGGTEESTTASQVGGASVGGPAGNASHSWTVASPTGAAQDALALADDVIRDWDTFPTSNGLRL